MPHPREINFSLSNYDKDGDKIESGVFLHFGGTRIKVAETVADFREIVPHFEAMIDEIGSTFPDAA